MSVNILSSANRDIECWNFCEDQPLMSGCDPIFSANGSISRAKMSRDRGHPCLIPFVILTFLENISSVKT